MRIRGKFAVDMEGYSWDTVLKCINFVAIL